MITLQNYKSKRAGFDLSKLSKDELEVFQSVDNEFDDYLELQNEVPEIKEMLNTHIELVNDLFKEAPAKSMLDNPNVIVADMRKNKDEEEKERTLRDAINEATLFKKFSGEYQLKAMRSANNSEEAEGLIKVVDRVEKELNAIPKIYSQDGKGDQAIVYAHLFQGGTDMFITEYDKEDNEAFGFTILNGDSEMAELGYINLDYITSSSKKIELDYYWKPKTLAEAKYQADKSYFPNPNEKKEAPAKADTKDTHFHVEIYDRPKKKWLKLANVEFGTYVSSDNDKPELIGMNKLDKVVEDLDELMEQSEDYGGYKTVNGYGKILVSRFEEENQPFKEGDIVQVVDLPKTVKGKPNPYYNLYGEVINYQPDDVRILLSNRMTDGFLEKNVKKTNYKFVPNDAPKKKESAKKVYEYHLRSRPFGIGTYPLNDNYIDFAEDGTRYGKLLYSEKLPIEDIKRFELAPITEIKELDNKTVYQKLGANTYKGKLKVIKTNRELYAVEKLDNFNGKEINNTYSGINALENLKNGVWFFTNPANEKKPAPKKKAPAKKVETVVDTKEVSHYTNEYMSIRRFYNSIRKNEILSFRKVQLMYMAFNKSALERKVRKTSQDAELFAKCHEKVVKMFKASDETKANVEVTIKDTKFLDDLMEYVGESKVNYAITLLKSFIGMQGKKPAVDKAQRLLNRFESALTKERVTCDNRLYKDFLKAKNELQAYIKDSSKPIEPNQVGLSATEKKNDNLNQDHENTDSTDNNTDSSIVIDLQEDEELIYREYEIQVVANNHIQEPRLVAGEKREAPAPVVTQTTQEPAPVQNDAPVSQYPNDNDDDFKVINDTEETKPASRTMELPEHLKNSGVATRMSDNKNIQAVYYKLQGDFAKFLGNVEIKPKESVAITLDAPQGAGKTRLVFQMLEQFASAGYRCLFASLEEHPQSALFVGKQDQYISPQNQENITTIGDLPENFDTLKEYIPFYDVIFVDSWSKMQELNKALDFDRDLRKAYDGKLFVVIFQRTSDGKMRGGSKSQFDGDIIMKIEKAEDFRNTYAYFDKHRYHTVPLDKLKYNTYSQTLLPTEDEPQSKGIIIP